MTTIQGEPPAHGALTAAERMILAGAHPDIWPGLTEFLRDPDPELAELGIRMATASPDELLRVYRWLEAHLAEHGGRPPMPDAREGAA